MTYIVERQDRFYVVAYDGLDPIAGRERRRWHPAGMDREEARLSRPASGVTEPASRPSEVGRSGSMTSCVGPGCRTSAAKFGRPRPTGTLGRRALHRTCHRARPTSTARADHLDDLYERLATTGGRHGHGLAPKTVLEIHMIVRAGLDLAVQRRLLDHSIAHSAHGRRRRAGSASARAWSADELAVFLVRSQKSTALPRAALRRAPACAAARSSGSGGPTSTAPPAESRYGGLFSASPGTLSSSKSRLAPAGGVLTSTPPPSPSSTGAAASYGSTVSHTVPTMDVLQPCGRSSTPSRSARCSTAPCSARFAPHPLPRPEPHPRLAAGR